MTRLLKAYILEDGHFCSSICPLEAHLSLIALVSYQEVPLSQRMSTFVLLLGIQELQQHIKSNSLHVGHAKRDAKGSLFMSIVHLVSTDIYYHTLTYNFFYFYFLFFFIFTLGHGRSACVMCATLVALGIAENWKDAESIIRERRKIKINALHRKTLEDWSTHRVPQKKQN
jgi:hypothetical protein